jgi:hypothetical protein
MPARRTWPAALIIVAMLAAQLACGSSSSGANSSSGSSSESGWLSLSSHIYAGVRVYYGDSKTYGFEVLGGSEDCASLESGRGIKVRYEDGTVEWKDRRALITSDIYYVKASDPALDEEDWVVFSDC